MGQTVMPTKIVLSIYLGWATFGFNASFYTDHYGTLLVFLCLALTDMASSLRLSFPSSSKSKALTNLPMSSSVALGAPMDRLNSVKEMNPLLSLDKNSIVSQNGFSLYVEILIVQEFQIVQVQVKSKTIGYYLSLVQ